MMLIPISTHFAFLLNQQGQILTNCGVDIVEAARVHVLESRVATVAKLGTDQRVKRIIRDFCVNWLEFPKRKMSGGKRQGISNNHSNMVLEFIISTTLRIIIAARGASHPPLELTN